MEKTNKYKIIFYTFTGTKKCASVFLNLDDSFSYVEYKKKRYDSSTEFKRDNAYENIITGNDMLKSALSKAGFIVRDSERINQPVHLMIPQWQLNELDLLRQTEFINFSRSDLINDILLKKLPSIPTEYPYEKGMSKTTITLNPAVLDKLDVLSSDSRTRNHLMYDCITEFLVNRNTYNRY